MNIFILDLDMERCARYHCDQHVVKMILESVQILCTALNKSGIRTPYKSTHINHPSVHWVERSIAQTELRKAPWYQALYVDRTNKTRQRDLRRLKEAEFIVIDKNNRLWPGCVRPSED